jgi:hypothetical protein
VLLLLLTLLLMLPGAAAPGLAPASSCKSVALSRLKQHTLVLRSSACSIIRDTLCSGSSSRLQLMARTGPLRPAAVIAAAAVARSAASPAQVRAGLLQLLLITLMRSPAQEHHQHLSQPAQVCSTCTRAWYKNPEKTQGMMHGAR